jgi:Mrp family chromosome partitioning ATPase
MSNTFELLESTHEDRELFQVPPVAKLAPAATISDRLTPLDQDVFTGQEILRLVQGLFLATGKKGEPGPSRVVFCGIDEPEGATLLCDGVGRSLAEQVHSEICVVDANGRIPTAHPIPNVSPFDRSAVPESTSIRNRMQRVTTNLWFVSTKSVLANGGAPSVDQMRVFIRTLFHEFPYVLIGAPPVGSYNDAILLGQLVDGVVLVLEANSTRRVAALKAKRALEAAAVQVLGTVLNNRTFPIPERIYRLV